MAFLSPLWLLALVPWALLAAWLLRGRRRRAKVPFLDLWRGPLPLEIPRRGWRTPPICLALMLVALLATLLAAGKPVIRSPHESGPPLTIIVDRGMSMSAMADGKPRFVAASEEPLELMQKMVSRPGDVRLVTVPGSANQSTSGRWIDVVRALPPTAIDTHEAVIAAVRDELARSNQPVLLISDQTLEINDARLVQIGPSRAFKNVGIAKLAARASPVPEVMVRLRNDSPVPPAPSPADSSRPHSAGGDTGGTAHLRVSSGQQVSERAVDLPPVDEERNYFFDLLQLDQVVEAELLDSDDQQADNRAWLVREKSFPRIEMRATLPPELRRMVEVYQHNRPPVPGSKLIVVTNEASQLAGDMPEIVVSPANGAEAVSGAINVVAHPITHNVEWESIAGHAKAAAVPGGFRPVVTVGGQALVAIRSEPARQVWVGFDAPGWSSSVDFVVFWANVFAWVGEGSEEFASHPLSDFQQDWKWTNPSKMSPQPLAGQWPGIYEAPDGSRFALNAPTVPSREIPEFGQMQKLNGMLASHEEHGSPMSTLLLVIAIGLMAAACWLWRSDVRAKVGLSGAT